MAVPSAAAAAAPALPPLTEEEMATSRKGWKMQVATPRVDHVSQAWGDAVHSVSEALCKVANSKEDHKIAEFPALNMYISQTGLPLKSYRIPHPISDITLPLLLNVYNHHYVMLANRLRLVSHALSQTDEIQGNLRQQSEAQRASTLAMISSLIEIENKKSAPNIGVVARLQELKVLTNAQRRKSRRESPGALTKLMRDVENILKDIANEYQTSIQTVTAIAEKRGSDLTVAQKEAMGFRQDASEAQALAEQRGAALTAAQQTIAEMQDKYSTQTASIRSVRQEVERIANECSQLESEIDAIVGDEKFNELDASSSTGRFAQWFNYNFSMNRDDLTSIQKGFKERWLEIWQDEEEFTMATNPEEIEPEFVAIQEELETVRTANACGDPLTPANEHVAKSITSQETFVERHLWFQKIGNSFDIVAKVIKLRAEVKELRNVLQIKVSERQMLEEDKIGNTLPLSYTDNFNAENALNILRFRVRIGEAARWLRSDITLNDSEKAPYVSALKQRITTVIKEAKEAITKVHQLTSTDLKYYCYEIEHGEDAENIATLCRQLEQRLSGGKLTLLVRVRACQEARIITSVVTSKCVYANPCMLELGHSLTNSIAALPEHVAGTMQSTAEGVCAGPFTAVIVDEGNLRPSPELIASNRDAWVNTFQQLNMLITDWKRESETAAAAATAGSEHTAVLLPIGSSGSGKTFSMNQIIRHVLNTHTEASVSLAHIFHFPHGIANGPFALKIAHDVRFVSKKKKALTFQTEDEELDKIMNEFEQSLKDAEFIVPTLNNSFSTRAVIVYCISLTNENEQVFGTVLAIDVPGIEDPVEVSVYKLLQLLGIEYPKYTRKTAANAAAEIRDLRVGLTPTKDKHGKIAVDVGMVRARLTSMVTQRPHPWMDPYEKKFPTILCRLASKLVGIGTVGYSIKKVFKQLLKVIDKVGNGEDFWETASDSDPVHIIRTIRRSIFKDRHITCDRVFVMFMLPCLQATSGGEAVRGDIDGNVVDTGNLTQLVSSAQKCALATTRNWRKDLPKGS